MKLEKWDMVIANCTNAINIDNKSTKALYHRGYAYYAKKKYEEAAIDINLALSYSPQEPSLVNLNSLIKNKLREQAKAEKSLWAKAFGGK
mmetsp:Transcript_13740/g.20434  ORF Transcript_13740/g.20434 Transcript_13740/m.20434 type:complete len:90 (+) Transcript_13740:70-339(+)